MKHQPILATAAALIVSTIAFAADDTNPTKQAMSFAHKAPRGDKKLNEKIVDGTAAEADIKKSIELYKAMADSTPPKGDAAKFKEKTTKLIAATEEVLEKKPNAIAHYKAAVDCKACHNDFRKMGPGPGGPGPR